MTLGINGEARTSGRTRQRGARLPYLPGLDGLRALAVIAVLLYHAYPNWVPGGFLGVDVFFVISGYLITALLLAEWEERGRIDPVAFWLRRARRLLPALFFLIAGVLTFAVLFLPGEVAGMRGEAAAAVAYVTNWYLIFVHQSYFQAVGRPSLLQHLWSLAVEEQFYLLWPLLLLFMLPRWSPRRTLVAVLAGAALSAALMALLYQPDADPSRVYYGTDTRAAALLIGAALAFTWRPWLESHPRRVHPLVIELAGGGAVVALAVAALQLNAYEPVLYRGGFAAVELLSAAAIAAIVYPRVRWLSSLLGRQPLRWIGLRSYSIYLWHWPVFMVTRPQLDVPLDGLPLFALRVILTCALAEFSYRFVETPIRSGALGSSWRALKETRSTARWWLGIRWAGALGALAIFSVALGESVASAQAPAPPPYLVESAPVVSPTTTPPATPTPLATRPALPSPTAPAATPTTSPLSRPQCRSTGVNVSAPPSMGTAPLGSAPQVYAIGDSVMLGAATQFAHDIPGIQVDAVVGRQVSTAIAILQARRSAGQLGQVVIVHLGNNGIFSANEFDEMMGVVSGVRLVVFVNDKVPRPWESLNNAVLAAGVKRYGNAALVDWYAASVNHPEYFWNDGIHLRPAGAQVYAGLIAACAQTP